MPIYHDYHGDAKSSSISTWDKIQISLKCLLPSYEPILCDSPVVSSFLSTQQICTDFPQTCSRIITAMNQFIQEEQADPAVESNLAENVEESENSNSATPDPAIQNSEYEIDEGDAAIIQNTHSVIDSSSFQHYRSRNSNAAEKTKFHQSDSKFSIEIHEGKIGIQYSNSTLPELENEATKNLELKKNTKPDLNSDRSQFQRQEDEDEDEFYERSIYQGCNDRSKTVAMQRPPPEPPDSYSFEVGDGEPPDLHSIAVGECEPETAVDDDTADQKRSSCVGNGTGAAFQSAEVGAFADDKESLTEGVVTSAEDSASLTGTVKNLQDGDRDRRLSGGQRSQRRRVFPFFGKSSILLAAVLPWNREEEWCTAEAKKRARQKDTLFDIRNNKKEGKESLSAAEATYSLAGAADRGGAPWKGCRVEVVTFGSEYGDGGVIGRGGFTVATRGALEAASGCCRGAFLFAIKMIGRS
ncbi:hypothetical protein PIB30_038269 [Stylosanthes scabra]|uniref:Uncharacterized protein n=1 Tax=Stylosanthes scabra TaxID=79078 RepID=A0ABU6XBM3_9FABA|nr:hypothetical protein [Stylosanthes scabra]